MTDPVETVVRDSARETVDPPPTTVERPDVDEAEFLGDEWADEFDRRLAAWEAEMPVGP
ncbi:MAG: hypothetical protein JSS49_28400 [Planctomycetes bacterium]|nr:hypothetical protein [Planctomycetota bacterium]